MNRLNITITALLLGITLNACGHSEEVKNTEAEDQTAAGVA
ncbi:MAG: hypothetical protein OSA77_08515 [Halioglobus sp.]|nr:hypothetical protein [Halioglobus sp.]